MIKKYLLFTTLLLTAFSIQVFSSGIQVQNTTVTTNQDKKSAQVKFTLTWDHSWRLAKNPIVAADSKAGPNNWDAAWVFIKYRTLPGNDWQHAYISTAAATTKPGTPSINGGNYFPSNNNAEIKVGVSPTMIGGVSANPGVGAFIYRKDIGNGTITFQDVELNWTFTQNGLTGGEQVEVCVLATEMVYIPEVEFYLGDQTSTGYFRTNYTPYTPYKISSAGFNFTNSTYVTNGTTTGNTYQSNVRASMGTWNNVSDDFATGTAYSISAFPTTYPSGFKAFYCMKYEITQGEYVQFLNKNLVVIKNANPNPYWSVQTTGRSAIVKKENTGTADIPAEYELSSSTAAYLPCGWLNTKDILGWLIWTGLRPMSEFEFEKVCRGPETVASLTADLKPQYAWGSTIYQNAAGFVNKGMANEGPSNSGGNCVFTGSGLDGPMRAGGFATPVSSRAKAGASYYGVMEMSGNLRERCVTFGKSTGRSYTGIHGHGDTQFKSSTDLSPILPSGWPSYGAEAGLGFRGGSYLDAAGKACISDRTDINSTDNSRKANYGGRGVRTAP